MQMTYNDLLLNILEKSLGQRLRLVCQVENYLKQVFPAGDGDEHLRKALGWTVNKLNAFRNCQVTLEVPEISVLANLLGQQPEEIGKQTEDWQVFHNALAGLVMPPVNPKGETAEQDFLVLLLYELFVFARRHVHGEIGDQAYWQAIMRMCRLIWNFAPETCQDQPLPNLSWRYIAPQEPSVIDVLRALGMFSAKMARSPHTASKYSTIRQELLVRLRKMLPGW
jgi:hypothetical protein